jgi:thiol-disulfide isomerase/thioredoxin
MNTFAQFNKPTGSLSYSTKSPNGLFSRVMSAGSKISTTTILIIVSICLFIFLAIYYYYYHVLPKLKTSYNANSEYSSKDLNGAGDKQAEMMLFYADWCPHCKTAKPIWNDIKTQYKNKTINGYHVIFTEVNCTTESSETEQMMNRYNIEGFPTIKLLKDGQVVEFDAKPTRETMNEFLNTVL